MLFEEIIEFVPLMHNSCNGYKINELQYQTLVIIISLQLFFFTSKSLIKDWGWTNDHQLENLAERLPFPTLH